KFASWPSMRYIRNIIKSSIKGPPKSIDLTICVNDEHQPLKKTAEKAQWLELASLDAKENDVFLTKMEER
ncbi:MAG: hypothetical protein ACRD99_07310, partial [Nitrososphaera sp.]